MVRLHPQPTLPTAEELPCSDETPVDNEIQNYIPNLLLTVLSSIWQKRSDWFFAVDMGIYYLLDGSRQPVIVPDGFLSIGVKRQKNNSLRLSYVLWEEDYIPPMWVLEIVSKTYGGEYSEKMTRYAELGVLYYTIYNPDYHGRDKHKPFEVYRLEKGKYKLQQGEPFWMPELVLGIGRGTGSYTGLSREWLYWYDREGRRWPTPEENSYQQQQRAQRAKLELAHQQQKAQQAELELARQQQKAQQTELELDRQRQRTQQAELEKEALQRQAISQLLKLGLSPQQVAESLGLSVETVTNYQ